MPRPKGMTAQRAQKLDRFIANFDRNFRSDAARWYAGLRLAGYTEAEADAIMYGGHRPKHKGKSCRKPGEFKPGGGRYAKKTCVPRRKPKRKCHRAGQFKPGGGRYKTTPCKRRGS